MSEIIRTFALPKSLAPERRERLSAAFGALQARQHHLANLTRHVAAAVDVRITTDCIELHYRVPGAMHLAGLTERPDGSTVERWAQQLSATFAAAYPAGQAAVMRHGGLTTDALAVDEAGDLVILDFGVAECFATALDPADDHWIRQVAAAVAPEIWTTPSGFGQSSDIFSAGVVLYQLATGSHSHNANPDDADDCKHRILIELPINPADAGAQLQPHVGRALLRALHSDAGSRFATFADLSATLAGTSLDSRDPSRHLTAEDLQDSTIEEHRQRYLEQQDRLRAQRRRTEQKWATRKNKLAHLLARMRQNLLMVVIVAIVVVGLMITAGMLSIRRSNAGAVERTLGAIASRMNEAFGPDCGPEIAAALGIEAPSTRLVEAINGLQLAAPATVFVFGEPSYTDWRCTNGTVYLDLADARIDFSFVRAGAGAELGIGDTELARKLINAGQALAVAKMDPAVRDLIARLREIFDSGAHAADVERQMSDRMNIAHPLGYLAYQGARARLNLGPFKPVVGRSAVRADVTVVDEGGQVIMSDVTPRILFDYTCNQSRTVCAVGGAALEPVDEPEAHKQWCMTAALTAASEALAAGDADRLAQLTTPTRQQAIERTIAWTSQCAAVSLTTRNLSTSLARAEVVIAYTPGMLNDQTFATMPVDITFDPDHEWRIRTDRSIDWPDAPSALLRQRLGTPLLETFATAWENGDAGAYLGLFPGSSRSFDDIVGMFAQIKEDGARFSIAAREDPASDSTLFIDVKPINAPSVSGGYITKSFGFAMHQGALQWNRVEDPLWIFAGRVFDSLVTRISRGPWDSIDALRDEFARSATGDLSSAERDIIHSWLEEIEAARSVFSPTGSTYVAGFPQQVRLQASPQVEFHLVQAGGPSQHLFYIQDRELAVSDIEHLWQKSTPWRDWTAVVGTPPRGQVVGLSLDEASEVATRLGCELPTVAEWNAGASFFGERPGKPGTRAFYGGVWEFCSDRQDVDDAPIIVGGCWHDYDPQLLAAGLPSPRDRSLMTRQERFGTIGLRLSRRLELPPEALAYSPAPSE